MPTNETINIARRAWPKSVEEWESRLADKKLDWLHDQTRSRINGEEYDKAILRLIKKRNDAGEYLIARRVHYLPPSPAPRADVVVQHVPIGPKGQTQRVEVPRHLCPD